MTVGSALKIRREFYDKSIPDADDEFMYIEALEYLIRETKSPQFMMELGGYYYEQKRFDLALKYYELAAAERYDAAYECLGYIWYYGRIDERDYEKAFHYYSKAAEMGNTVCRYKVADMYKNGCYVEQDYDKYKEIIEEIFRQMMNSEIDPYPLPEIYTRMAGIRKEQGRIEEAVGLYREAKEDLALRISDNPFFGNLNIMKRLIEDLYKLTDPEPDEMDLYDLYHYLQKPVHITFRYRNITHDVRAAEEDGAVVICFNGKWFRTADDFFGKAAVGNKLLTSIYDELYDFKVEDIGWN